MALSRKKILTTIMVVFLLVLLPMGSYYFLSQGKDLWDKREVADYTLTDQAGETFTLSQLDDKVHVAAFLFSSCASPYCQDVLATQAYLQEKFRNEDDFVILTITIDPEVDSVATIRAWADSAGAVYWKWMFLTGEKEAIQRVAVTSYSITKLRFREERFSKIKASPKLVLIGRDGYIKGYYKTGKDDREELVEAIQTQLNPTE